MPNPSATGTSVRALVRASMSGICPDIASRSPVVPITATV
jgi:hypothetical protein